MPRTSKITVKKISNRKTKIEESDLEEDSRTLAESSYVPLFAVTIVILLIILVVRNVTYKRPEPPINTSQPTIIEDTESSLTTQVKNLPVGWPDEIDLVDGAVLKTSTEEKEKNTKVVVYTTNQSAQNVVSFYNRKLADAAWQGKGFRVAGDLSLYTYTKDGSTLTIEVSKKAPTTVTLTLQD